MFRHVVVLTFAEDATDAQVTAVVEGLRALPAQIPELRGYEVGRDLGLEGGDARVVAVADCDDVDGYLAYRDHPAHQRVIAERIRPILAARTAVQHER